MKTQDKIMKVLLNSVEGIKDTVERNVVAAITTKQLSVPKESIPGLVLLLKNSVDDGFNKSHSSLTKSITALLDEAAHGVEQSKSQRKVKKGE